MKSQMKAIFVLAVLALPAWADIDHGARFQEDPRIKGRWRCVNREGNDAHNLWIGECGWNRDEDLRGLSRDGVDLNGSFMLGANLTDARLTNCQMRSVTLQDANLGNGVFAGSNLEKAWIAGTQAVGADFSGTNLQEARFFVANLTGAKFIGADLRRAKFTSMMEFGPEQGTLKGADFTNARLEGADLYYSSPDGSVSFQGATYDSSTRLPVLFEEGEAEKRGMRQVGSP